MIGVDPHQSKDVGVRAVEDYHKTPLHDPNPLSPHKRSGHQFETKVHRGGIENIRQSCIDAFIDIYIIIYKQAKDIHSFI